MKRISRAFRASGALGPGAAALALALLSALPAAATSPEARPAAPAEVTLEWCQEAARANYPALAKASLIDRSEGLALAAANTAWLPRVTLSGKYTDQSDVTKIELSLPAPLVAPDVPAPDTVQYQVGAELSQTIWDGGLTFAKKKSVRAGAEADRTKLETGLYALRSQVLSLYFGVMVVDGQLGQNATLRDELATNERRVAAWVANGVATASDLDAVRVEMLNAEQAHISLASARSSLVASLALMTGAEFSGKETFPKPDAPAGRQASGAAVSVPAGPPGDAEGLARPETAWFAALESANDSQKAQLVAQAMPKLSAFLQAGYGAPGLNVMDPDPAAFWIAGVRVAWSVDGFWSLPFTLSKVDSDSAQIAADRDAFYRSVALAAAGKREEIARLEALVASDGKLVELRGKIKAAAKTKLDNGTIGTVDYLGEINSEALARQAKALHEIRLLQARFELNDTLNE